MGYGDFITGVAKGETSEGVRTPSKSVVCFALKESIVAKKVIIVFI